jgi:hypothetical protein
MVSRGAEDLSVFDLGTFLTATLSLALVLVLAEVPYSFLRTFFFFYVPSLAAKSSSSWSDFFFFLVLVAAFGKFRELLSPS